MPSLIRRWQRSRKRTRMPRPVPGVFIEVCSEEVQAVYDQIWTNVKK